MSDKTFVKHPKPFGKSADVISAGIFNIKFLHLAKRTNITPEEYDVSKVIEVVKGRGEELSHGDAAVYAFGYFLGVYLNKFETPLSEEAKVVSEVYGWALEEGYKSKVWPKSTILQCLSKAIEEEKITPDHAIKLRSFINDTDFTDLFHKEL